ncbi:hypothetical protein MKW98_009856 [Papaver atlanticum]|uniref:Uncharacterized protein n=1 Tax=Papaver atlanticum TaxID=357466 RepID=A0AAD4TA82_9MAGN|nr:hypothetical protein MKW98_009856 [Papaver atlanticum]
MFNYRGFSVLAARNQVISGFCYFGCEGVHRNGRSTLYSHPQESWLHLKINKTTWGENRTSNEGLCKC